MIDAIKRGWADIKQGENIDLYLTLTVAIVLAGLNLFGIGQSMMGSITLAVLALLAFSSLVNRRKLEETIDKLSRDQAVLLDHYPASRDEDMKGAKELWLIGLSLNKTINNYYSLFYEKLRQGDHIRVLIVSPESPYGEIVAKRKFSRDTLTDIRKYQELTLSKLCSLKVASPQNLEIRTTNYPPFFGAVAIDLESIEGVMYIEQYSYQMEDDRPKFLFQQSDTKWFQFYKQQIIKMWNDGNEWNCVKTD
jgi:hypothetical protein